MKMASANHIRIALPFFLFYRGYTEKVRKDRDVTYKDYIYTLKQ